MNRLLQLARQMHQRRMSYFYLTPDDGDNDLNQRLALGSNRAPVRPLYRDDAFEDGYGFDEPDAYDPREE